MPIWSRLEDTAPLDRLVRLATRIAAAPIALVSLEREGELQALSWTGLPEPWASTGELPRPFALCDHVLRSGEVEVIADTRGHPRLTEGSAGDALGVGAYIGIPLRSGGGRVVGVFAVMDLRPHSWDAEAVAALRDLAHAAVTEIELRNRTGELERVLAEQQQSDELFRQLMVNIQEAFWMTDPELSRVLYVSPALDRIYGRDMSGTYHNPLQWAEYIHPADLPRVRAELEGKPLHQFDVEYRVVRPDGELRWVHARGFPVRDDRERIFRVAGLTEDVTERKRAEQALAEREERLRDILESITDRFFALDADWRIVFINRHAAERAMQVVGRRREELIGQNFWQVVPAALTGSRFEHELRRVMEERAPVHLEEHLAFLDTWYEANIYPSPGGGISVYSRDITERKRAAAALAEAQGRRRLVVELSPDAYVETDAAGQITEWNRAAEALFGWSREEALGREVAETIVPPDLRAARLPGLVRLLGPDGVGNADGGRAETRAVRRDGSEIPVEITLTAIPTGDGDVLASFLHDIGTRKRAERQIQAQLEEKTVLLQEVHHRVKNNLQIISSLLNMQIRALADPRAVAALRESQDRIRAIALVHETLYRSGDFARVELSDYLRRLAGQIHRSYGIGRGIELRLELEPCTVSVLQAVPCGLIVNELVSNAVEHAFTATPGGEVRVRMWSDTEGHCVLRVSDSGTGIPAEVDLESPHTVGLQLVRMLSGQLHGTLEASRGPGTAFQLRFPTRPNGE